MNFKDSKKHHWKTALFCSHPLYLGQMGREEFPKHCCYVASFLLIIFFSFIIVFIVEYSAYYFPSSPIKRQDTNNKDLSHSEQGLFFKNVQGLVYIADGWKRNSMRIYLWLRIWLSLCQQLPVQRNLPHHFSFVKTDCSNPAWYMKQDRNSEILEVPECFFCLSPTPITYDSLLPTNQFCDSVPRI